MNTQITCNGNPILLHADFIEYDDQSETADVLLFIHDGMVFVYPFMERDWEEVRDYGLNFICNVFPVRVVEYISGAQQVPPEISDAFFEWFRNPIDETVERFSKLYIEWIDSFY